MCIADTIARELWYILLGDALVQGVERCEALLVGSDEAHLLRNSLACGTVRLHLPVDAHIVLGVGLLGDARQAVGSGVVGAVEFAY